MKLDFGKGTAHAARRVNAIIWYAIMLAVLGLSVRWLGELLDSMLVAVVLAGLALVSLAPLAVDDARRHPPRGRAERS